MTAAPARLGSYALFGMPLAMAALPIYVLVPASYAARTGLSLASIGAALLAARLLAAAADPWFGQQLAQRGGAYRAAIALAAPLLLASFGLLLFPPAAAPGTAWLFACLLAVNLSHGLASVAYQSWGAALGGAPTVRSRVTAAREACGLAGVLVACLFTGPADLPALYATFAALLCAGAALLLVRAPRPAHGVTASGAATAAIKVPAAPRSPSATALSATHASGLAAAWRAPWRRMLAQPAARKLLAAFALNGLAAGVASALFLFYVRDRLQLHASAGALLLLYFLSAAVSAPFWARLAPRYGERRLWRAALFAGGAVFAGAALLQPGAAALPWFALICCLCGIALGADLVLPSAALAALIERAGDAGAEGSYFGIWHLTAQLTLALASGAVLPLLAWFGYAPGANAATLALALCYAGIPAALRLLAAAALSPDGGAPHFKETL